MLGNPVSAYYIVQAHELLFLTVIFNNERWESVDRATRAMYPDGYAAKVTKRRAFIYNHLCILKKLSWLVTAMVKK